MSAPAKTRAKGTNRVGLQQKAAEPIRKQTIHSVIGVDDAGNALGVTFPVAVHPAKSDTIVVMMAGLGGSLDGDKNRWKNLGEFMRDQGIGAVVRAPNPGIQTDAIPYSSILLQNMRTIIRTALDNAKDICGTDKPRILLVGFSAGGSAAAAVAHEFPEVQELLLLAPSVNSGGEELVAGLQAFTGRISIIVGDKDPLRRAAEELYLVVLDDPSRVKYAVVTNCDHQFSGKEQSAVFAFAPRWAFKGDHDFPVSEGVVTHMELSADDEAEASQPAVQAPQGEQPQGSPQAVNDAAPTPQDAEEPLAPPRKPELATKRAD